MNKIKAITVFMAFFAVVMCDGGGLTDSRDGKKYKTVKIGEQTWMAENLNYAADGSKCYDNNPTNCDKYGRLYNWETAKKACPSGWHLPSKSEWETLTAAVGGEETEGKYLKATSGWEESYGGESGNGNDKFGFAALPGGFVSYDGGFYNANKDGIWWSASSDLEDNAFAYDRSYYRGDNANWLIHDKNSVLVSVRCLQGPEIERKSVGNKETQTETMKRPIQSNDRTSPAGQKKSTKARKKAVDGIDSEQLQYWMENTEEE